MADESELPTESTSGGSAHGDEVTVCPSIDDEEEEEEEDEGDENKLAPGARIASGLKEDDDEEERQRVELEAREMSVDDGGGVSSGDC